MNKKIILSLILFILFGFSQLHAQSTKIDSLLYKLQVKGNLSQNYFNFFNNLDNKSLKAADGTRYFIKKFIPKKSINYKILVITADPNIDYKILNKDFSEPKKTDNADKKLLEMLKKKLKNYGK